MNSSIQEHINTLTIRYLFLKQVIADSGGTKNQRKEFNALKWVLSYVKRTVGQQASEPVPPQA